MMKRNMTGQEREVEKTVVGSSLCARDRQAESLAIARAQRTTHNAQRTTHNMKIFSVISG
jgi:hypothetical protein